jgi:hypothetical protein
MLHYRDNNNLHQPHPHSPGRSRNPRTTAQVHNNQTASELTVMASGGTKVAAVRLLEDLEL